jgi:hypothetical protein
MNQLLDKSNTKDEKSYHDWVQFDLLNDVCSKCGEMAWAGDKGIQYPDTPCLGKR